VRCGEPARSNCLAWAIAARLRRGGRVLVRRAPGGWLRFLWRDRDGICRAYLPLAPRKGWRAVLHKLRFRGRVYVCDCASGRPLRRDE